MGTPTLAGGGSCFVDGRTTEGSAMSDTISTGCHGKPCRQNVLCGVEIPLVRGAASRACPCPGGKLDVAEHAAAGTTGFRAWIPAVDGELRGLPAQAGFAPRMAGTFGVEVGESPLLRAQHLLQWHRRHLIQVRVARVAFEGCQEGVGLRHARRSAFLSPAKASPFQGCVPDLAHAAESAGQGMFLLWRRVCPAPEPRSHPHILPSPCRSVMQRPNSDRSRPRRF